MRLIRRCGWLVVSGGLAAAVAPSAASARLLVGVGRADITPLTGVYKGGWACTCAKVIGQHERLYARVIVLQEGHQKVALVSEDLFALSAGMVRDAASLLGRLGFSEQNIIDSATHTHSSQSGYMNYAGDNLILPSTSNADLSKATGSAADPVMYSFMTRQLALAIRRANANLRPGAVGWGETRLVGVTQNRSLGAHLADYGITSAGANGGSVSQDPNGYLGTIDPAVNVIRVDQFRRLAVGGPGKQVRRVPVGMFSTFANHGTIDHENFWYFAADHQGAAERAVETTVRRLGHAPGSQDVVNAFANSDAGDMTAGIQNVGPADAEKVGRQEAAAMLAAWRQAGRAMSTHPTLTLRWTRTCFCGQNTGDGFLTDSSAWVGKAAGAGSEEGRTIFYYQGLANEGDKLPVDVGPQGDKIRALNATGSISQAVPFTALRIGDGVLVTVPAEPTVGVGNLIRAAVRKAISGSGVRHVDIAGYAGDYLNYFTTPSEYEQQAYEGGFTMYGEYSALILRDTLAELARDAVTGRPAPAPYDFDPSAGVHVTSADYGGGAASATVTGQPGPAVRLGHTSIGWSSGGADGVDRPVDRPFVTIQRRVSRRWLPAADDLGMQIEWSSDQDGAYHAAWEVPLSQAPGTYRFRVTAKRYTLSSRPFAVRRGAILSPTVSGGAVRLGYPQPYLLNDWTSRPEAASGGSVTFRVDAGWVALHLSSGTRFRIPGGKHVVIPAGGARDAYGNTNPRPVTVR
jgi:hypothetical protein